ncbi:MAG: stage II sporulation protein P [Bacilli bacterium]|nr:stage II sporulation protein P [Bacilli bacterium]
MKKTKKRRFKFRLLGYILLIFLGYQISFNIFMNFRLKTTNESFIRALLIDSNYYMLYEKKASNLLTRVFSKIIDVNKPVTILDNVFHLKQNKIDNIDIAYVSNPNTETIEKNPEVFLYNTHQGESYEGKALEGYNITPGVMMASYIMQKKLMDQNINTLVMEENINDYLNLNNMRYSKSYLVSRKFLEEILNKNKDLKLIIDIHRDSISKEKSTININGKSCAKILFVIGKEYSTYQENLKITNNINNKIKEKYPSLTRGVIIKGGKGNNGIYNQDLNSNITLMEIGGEKNTIEEVLNTIDLIAPILGEYINES